MDEQWKYLYALDVAVAEQFEWDYENAPDYNLYEAIEALGYEWIDGNWVGPEAVAMRVGNKLVSRERYNAERAKLRAWEAWARRA